MTSSPHETIAIAYEAILTGDLPLAERTAQALLHDQVEDGADLLAAVFRARDDLPGAIRVLQESTQRSPSAHRLMSLANCLSEAGQFQEARAIYEQLRSVKGADAAAAAVNAIVLNLREHAYLAAINACDEVRDPQWQLIVRDLRSVALAALGRWVELHELTQSIDEELPLAWDLGPADRDALVGTATRAAIARHRTGHANQALFLAKALLLVEQECADALAIVRSLAAERSPSAHCYRLVIRGRWFEEMEEGVTPSFRRVVYVSADSSDEALRLAAELEFDEVRASVVAESCDQVADVASQPKGVVQRSRYAFHPHEQCACR